MSGADLAKARVRHAEASGQRHSSRRAFTA